MHALSPETSPQYGSFALPWEADRADVVSSPEQLRSHLDGLPVERRTQVRVLGELTNTVVAEHVPGEVVLFRDGRDIQVATAADGTTTLTVDASRSLDAVVADTTELGLHGMELLSGIPGTVGSAVVQNAGAYGQEIADVFVHASAYEMATGEVVTLTAEDLDFAYRTSALKPTTAAPPPLVLLTVVCQLPSGPPAAMDYDDLVAHHADLGRPSDDVAARRLSVLDVRARKGMVVDGPHWRPSAGSFFVGPDVPRDLAVRIATDVRGEAFADRMLERAGPDDPTPRVPAAIVLRAAGFMNGDHWGRVGLSDRHVLALCNRGGATGTDVVAVSGLIQSTVRERLGIELRREVILLGDFPDVDLDAYARAHPRQAGTAEPAWARATSG